MRAVAEVPTVERRIHEMAKSSIPWGAVQVGVDLVDITQLERQLAAAGDRLARRWFTASERTFCGGDVDRLASTLAGKEAVAKVLRTGFRTGVRWTQIEIEREPDGSPVVVLHDVARRRAELLGLTGVAISLCHEGNLAVAVASALPREMDR